MSILIVILFFVFLLFFAPGFRFEEYSGKESFTTSGKSGHYNVDFGTGNITYSPGYSGSTKHLHNFSRYSINMDRCGIHLNNGNGYRAQGILMFTLFGPCHFWELPLSYETDYTFNVIQKILDFIFPHYFHLMPWNSLIVLMVFSNLPLTNWTGTFVTAMLVLMFIARPIFFGWFAMCFAGGDDDNELKAFFNGAVAMWCGTVLDMLGARIGVTINGALDFEWFTTLFGWLPSWFPFIR